MTDRIIIGLTGLKRSGKDTVATYIKQYLQDTMPVTFVSFAEPMRQMLKHIICGCTRTTEEEFAAIINDDRKETYKFPVINRTYRELMQTLGTEWGRDLVKPTLWVDLAESQIQKTSGCVIVTDVRFENEAFMLRNNYGQILHVQRQLDNQDTHRSEAGVSKHPMDCTLYNYGTLEDLKENTVSLLINHCL